MNVKILASGSSGNCVVIDDVLAIDAGHNVSYEEIAGVEALLITHSHADHIKYITNFEGVPMHSTADVERGVLKRSPYLRFNRLYEDTPKRLKLSRKTYTITPLRMQHDVPCVGFDITDGSERILYATDFHSILSDIDLRNYDALYVECNNTLEPSDMVEVFFDDPKPTDEFHRRRSYYNHCNVSYLIELFKRNGFDESNKFDKPVTLLHKSSHYYHSNVGKIVELCKVAKIVNPTDDPWTKPRS